MRRTLHRVFAFYWGEGIADDVPALAYYLVLSLAPFAFGVAALALRLDDQLTALSVADQLNRYLPTTIHDDVEQLVLRTRADSPELLAVAVAGMLWTTSGAIGVIERCLSRILACERHHVVTGRLRNMALGGMVAIAVVLAVVTTSAANDVGDALGLRRTLPPAITVSITTGGSVLLFAAIYRYAPRARLRWRWSLLGALPAGIGLQLVPAVVGVYVSATAGVQAVRVFLVLAVVLLGLSIIATFVLVGAGIAACSERRARARVEARGAAAPVAAVRSRGPVPGGSERVGSPS
jgi:membrane protein